MSNDKERDLAHSGWLAGGSEMGALIRAKDWAKTPLGPAGQWPQSLRSAVSILLPSKAQIVLFWGRALITLYNDAYRSVFGAKHPRALGLPAHESWSELWDAGLRELFEGVLETGEAFWANDRPFFVERFGYPEETFFDVSYDPVRDETGQVGGIFCIVNETTARVVAERRLKTLQELSAKTTEGAKSVEQVCQVAARILANNRHDLAFALIYLLDDEGKNAWLTGSMGLPEGSPIAPLCVDTTAPKSEAMAWPFRAVLAAGRAEVMTDLERVGPLQGSIWPESPNTAVVLPISASGQKGLAGFLVTGVSPRRPLDDQYRGFFDLLTNQIATSIANVLAFEEVRKRADALTELDRAKTSFFSNVSHEFRTPLTLMLGPLEELKSQFGRSTSAVTLPEYQQLDLVQRNALRLLKLVNTLLDFSRIEAGRVHARYEITDLSSFTAELASVFRSAIEKAGLRLIIDCSSLHEEVYVDREMWEKIVLNLLSNAFKFTLKGEIEVSLKESGARRVERGEHSEERGVGDERSELSGTTRHVILSVRDTGSGIPLDQLGKIFERFHRVPGAEGRTHEGTGIGLALVQELAGLHGGSVSVDSRYGKGSTFHVFIPFGKGHLPHKQVDASRAPAPTALDVAPFVEESLRWLSEGNRDELRVLSAEREYQDTLSVRLLDTRHAAHSKSRPLVLVADDNADMCQYIARLLVERYRVETVPDGVAALAALRERRPDLILSDVMMPRLDGFGLLRELRNDPDTSTIPVILLSARAGEESSVEGLEQGADDYLIKPFSARELLARVGAHLDLARLRREADAALRQSEERFARFMQHLPGLAWVKDEQGRYVYANDAAQKAFHTPQERLCGKTDEEVFPPEIAAQFRENDRRVLAGGTGVQVVETLEHQDGLLHHSLVSKFPIPGPDGQTTLIGGIAVDITERKQAEEALRRLNDELEQRVAERTQALVQSQDRLRALASEVNLAEQRERKRLATELHDHLQQLLVLGKLKLGQGKRLADTTPLCAKLINETDEVLSDALQYTRTLVAELSPPALRDHGLAAGLKWLGDDMKKHDMAVTVTVAEGAELDVPEDRSVLLFQSVRELLINASKHAGTHEAWVKLEQRDGQLVIEVKDNGVGFDLAAAADTPNGDLSSKFGLFSIRERMRVLGGEFHIASAVGQGTTATLSLPLRSSAECSVLSPELSGSNSALTAQDSALPSHSGLRTQDSGLQQHAKIRVLLVDDHAMVRQGLRTVLDSYADIEVVGEARDGEEAVAATEALHPAVVLMDINMPKMNGIEATAQIKARHPEVIVIGLSVNARGENERAMKQAGAATLLTKEAAMDELYRVMQEVLKTNV